MPTRVCMRPLSTAVCFVFNCLAGKNTFVAAGINGAWEALEAFIFGVFGRALANANRQIRAAIVL